LLEPGRRQHAADVLARFVSSSQSRLDVCSISGHSVWRSASICGLAKLLADR
jgi:hypothetical protein